MGGASTEVHTAFAAWRHVLHIGHASVLCALSSCLPRRRPQDYHRLLTLLVGKRCLLERCCWRKEQLEWGTQVLVSILEVSWRLAAGGWRLAPGNWQGLRP